MLLNELTGVKKYYNKNKYQIERMLAKFGIHFIAAGKYGQVFTSDKWDYVVKIFQNDPHYLNFVNYAIAHPNPHYPKFVRKPLQMHAFQRRMPRNPNRYWIVKIEKLKPLLDDRSRMIIDYLEPAMQAWYNQTHNRSQDTDNDWTYMNNMIMPDGQRERMKWVDVFKMYPWLRSLAEAWYNIFENIEDGSPDIHAENFMQRQDGTIVIIDPIWQGTNPLAQYQAFLDRESAGMMDDYEEEDVKGPDYLHKKQQAAIQATRSFASQIDDDIPF